MEKSIKKRGCVGIGVDCVLIVLFSYWFFLNSHDYWQKQKETEKMNTWKSKCFGGSRRI